MTVSPGTRIGRYEVRSLLGAGGMGEVYRARDHELERDVAVKILRGTGLESSGLSHRFVQEAKAASGLHHPNVAHVYEIGSQDDLRFIAMEIIEGETLRHRLQRDPMPVDQVLEIGTQIASALAAAHKAGIVHRDVKPENVMITPDGYAKVLDFGLAKLRETRGDSAATLLKTTPGVAMGTLGYMAPEQLVGGEVGAQADVFSLGVVLYEMIGGRKPFEGATTSDLVSSILTKSPRPLHELRADVPPRLEAVVQKAMAKDAAERWPDAGAIHDELREISRGIVVAGPVPARVSAKMAIAAVTVLVIVAAAATGAWALVRANRRRQALSKVTAAEALLKDRKLADAYEMAMSALPILPNDARLREVVARTSDRLTIESDPPGAAVYLQRYQGPAARERRGVTPLTIRELERADYLLTLEKPGYAPATRTISTMPVYNRGEPRFDEIPAVRMRLAEASRLPAGMVLVEGGQYRLAGSYRPSERVVGLSDFFIDRCEVSNRDFEQFVRDGGYRKRELWKEPFIDGGKTLSFDEAMARFHDTTSVAGPRSWSGGAPPPGLENHPVTDITWYEAAAFAEWKGKKLPSVYQWERAARSLSTVTIGIVLPWATIFEGVDVTERANFLGRGTMPVDSMPFGASPWGALHMAGNVSEWCRNPLAPGYAARGGSYRDAIYAFGQTAAYPPFYSAPTLGFRCVSGGKGDEGDFRLSPSGFVPEYKPVDDKTFAGFLPRYEYKRGPLQARVVETVDTPDWRREKITFVVAGKTVPSYLYTPKGFRPPYQVIQFAPAGDVVRGWRTLPHSIEINLAPLIRAGRALFSVELEGFLGRPRPAGWVPPDPREDEYVDEVVARVTEMRRGLDYLETRKDIDSTRIAFLGISAGGGPGVLITGLESRYRSVIFQGSGISTDEGETAPAANRINFVPRIRGPKLMLQGRYDEDTPLKSDAEPMFRLLREPKRFQIFDGPHVPPLEVSIPTFQSWLDDTMGKVQQ